MKETEKIKKRYDRISKVYDWLEQPMEWMMFEKWRQEVSESLKGKVLEIGVGTGKNRGAASHGCPGHGLCRQYL